MLYELGGALINWLVYVNSPAPVRAGSAASEIEAPMLLADLV